ncbi:MAG: Gfo/Idh/MocA family oxidoreductase [Thermofilum sp.]|nr:Gfo/Idh/MocA family oxidoreductase [Thermofilum sp.]
MEKARLGVVGVGRRGLDHIRVLSQLKEASLEAVCDVDEKRLREVASTYGVRAYKSLDEMLEREKLDAVVIATPVPMHVPQAIQCVEAGLDVLLEKPVSLDMGEVMRLLKVVEGSDRMVAVAFQSRYSNLAGKIRETIDERTLSMVAGYWYWTIPPISWIRLRSQAGGQVVEQAIHLIDLARFFAGEVESVYAVYTERGRDTEEDRAVGFDNWASYVVALKFENSAVGCIYSTYALYPGIFRASEGVAPESPVTMDIVCREMLIRYAYPSEVRVYRKGRETEAYRLLRDPTIDMHKAFIEAVLTRDKKLLRTPYEDSYKTMAVALAANESAMTGNRVHLPTFLSKYSR